jgi:hypothetical protein
LGSDCYGNLLFEVERQSNKKRMAMRAIEMNEKKNSKAIERTSIKNF